VSKWYTVAQVTALYVGPHRNDPEWNKVYERIQSAIYYREVGRVRRLGRGWLLTEYNLKKLAGYMEQRWGMTVLSEQGQRAQPPQEHTSAAI
jgi:hypothetical protein